MNALLWVLQFVLATFFFFHGNIKLNLPPEFPEMLTWINDLSPSLRTFIGLVELLGALGLLLPAVTRIQPRLIPLAAAGLSVVMLLAAIWHYPRGETALIANNIVLLVLTAFVAYGRWKLHPIPPR
ncbi:MAG: DoxX family protein [Anaerolineae bacterium]|nr:DoxX family protein [Anaerolineae bacterium]